MRYFIKFQFILVLLTLSLLNCQAQNDLLKLDGEQQTTINTDDVKLLGVLARSKIFALTGTGKLAPIYKLVQETVQAYKDKDYYKAYRLVSRFLFVTNDKEVGVETEVVTSLNLVLGASLLDKGQTLSIALSPLFTFDLKEKTNLVAELHLLDSAGNTLKTIAQQDIDAIQEYTFELDTEGFETGNYAINYILKDKNSQEVWSDFKRLFRIDENLVAETQKLREIFDQLSPSDFDNFQEEIAFQTIRYHLEYFEAAISSYKASMKRNAYPVTNYFHGARLSKNLRLFRPESLSLASQFAQALLSQEDIKPLMTGDLHLAYLSDVDNTPQPFRVYVPKDYQKEGSSSLILTLHGASANEHTFLDEYVSQGTNYTKKNSEEFNYIIASPSGRGPFGGYIDDSEQDVIDVRDTMLKLFNIKNNRVFLMGHSMGGIGTWLVGMRHSEKFSALVPFAGQPEADKIAFENAPDMPVLFIYGEKDKIAPINKAKELDAIAKEKLNNYQFKVYSEANHFNIGILGMKDAFLFFEEN